VGRYSDDDEPLSFNYPWAAFALAGWGLAYFWLSVSVEWPEDCRPSARGVAGLVSEYLCGPALLGAGPDEQALFFVLWSFPATLIFIIVWFKFFRRGAGEDLG
jgi:hypothetical protein